MDVLCLDETGEVMRGRSKLSGAAEEEDDAGYTARVHTRSTARNRERGEGEREEGMGKERQERV